MLLNGLLHLSAQHVSGIYMPIIMSPRLYLRYYRIWCVMPWLLVVGGQVQGSRLCARDEGSCSSIFPYPGRIACCPAPDCRPPATKSSHTMCGNNTSIVSGSWWWAYKCLKHVEHIISAINHSVASSFLLYASANTVRKLVLSAMTKTMLMRQVQSLLHDNFCRNLIACN